MDQMIAFCGLNCGECEAFIATKNSDPELKKKIAAQWTEQFHHPIKPEDINCVGCASLEGAHIGYCGQCEIRACGIAHGVPTCAACAEYGCGKLTKFWAMAPAAKANLDAIRQGK
jgi:hypothetical protein